MALWTPYAEEVALDLSKTTCSERASPLPAAGAPRSYPLRGFYGTDTDTRQNYYGYQYQSAISYAVSQASSDVSQMSSSSVESELHIKPHMSSPPESISLDTELLSEDPDYKDFERDALQAMAEKNGGTLLFNNPRMRRKVQTSQAADDSYRRQRERNNFAAKQSRDRRKLREIRLALQVQYLKKKMADLKTSLATGVCGRCRHIREW